MKLIKNEILVVTLGVEAGVEVGVQSKGNETETVDQGHAIVIEKWK